MTIVLAVSQAVSALAHLMRLYLRPEDPRSRRVIAGGGILLYTAAACLAAFESNWGALIAIGGPAIGLSAVVASGELPDDYQIAVGIGIQVPGVLLGFGVLL